MSAATFTLLSGRATRLYGVRVDGRYLGLVGPGGSLAGPLPDCDPARWYAFLAISDDEGTELPGSFATRAAAARALADAA